MPNEFFVFNTTYPKINIIWWGHIDTKCYYQISTEQYSIGRIFAPKLRFNVPNTKYVQKSDPSWFYLSKELDHSYSKIFDD